MDFEDVESCIFSARVRYPRLEDSSSLTNRLYSNRVYSLQSSLLGFSFTAIGISLHLSSRLSRYYRRAKLRPSIDLSSRGEHRLAWILNWGERNIGLGWEYNFLIIPPLVSSYPCRLSAVSCPLKRLDIVLWPLIFEQRPFESHWESLDSTRREISPCLRYSSDPSDVFTRQTFTLLHHGKSKKWTSVA